MQLRNACQGDHRAILELYKRVASVPGGLARLADEIDEAYVTSFLTSSMNRGICLVAAGPGDLQAEIHAYAPVPKCFSHVLSDLTIAVDPSAQGKGLGRRLFETFMLKVEETHPHVLRVELIARESNAKAIRFYETLGFTIEGRMDKRIASVGGGFESDIPMAWLRA
ncbi:MAG: N-acetyltransferase [Pseudomonadales bacterium]|nr:GNAT family N-acetyltransferase [Pseudomonadales bacterium]